MSTEDPRRRIPRTDRILADPRVRAAAGGLGDAAVRAAVVSAPVSYTHLTLPTKA